MEVLLGVTGCIGACKAPEVVRLLRREGVGVTVIMTRSARWFVTEGTLATLSGRPVYSDLFTPQRADVIEHIELARRADLLLIAPATAHTIARLALGLADDFLSTCVLAWRGPLLVAPAMNTAMFEHPAVRENLGRLRERGVEILGPAAGELACGEVGDGRLVEPEDLVAAVLAHRLQAGPRRLSGRMILVTSGPTREPIDAVRYISSPSSGRMGHALARAAQRAGARVVLISGPTALPDPEGVEMVRVSTAREMEAAVAARAAEADAVFMAAAVGDFESREPAAGKIRKSSGPLALQLEPTPDILAGLGARRRSGGGPLLVGFAAETGDAVPSARAKLIAKSLDVMVANRIDEPGAGFASDTNRVTVLTREGETESWPLQSKNDVAARLVALVAARLSTPSPAHA